MRIARSRPAWTSRQSVLVLTRSSAAFSSRVSARGRTSSLHAGWTPPKLRLLLVIAGSGLRFKWAE